MIQAILSQAVFAKRRTSLLAQLPEGSVVLLFAASQAQRNSDVHYPFRQESYFWYLTGFPEPDAVALLAKRNGSVHYTLFSAKRDAKTELWSGKIIGQENAMAHYQVDDAQDFDALPQLPAILAEYTRIYTILGVSQHNDDAVMTIIRQVHVLTGRGGAALEGVFDLRRIVDEMRMVKSPEERALLHRAGKISALGQCAGMLATRPGVYEYEIQSVIEAEFMRHDGCHWAYGSIIAGGANACCLHYGENNDRLEDGALVLFDAGAEYAGYAGDITRTIPVNGKFSRDQQALYEVVLQAQKNAIDAARAGIQHETLHQKTAIWLMQGIIDLGIIAGDAREWVESGEYKQFYPHGTGHWLGMDVHDVGVYRPEGQSRTYVPGMVITIEPGLYFQIYDTGVNERWRGIGIRIEDDIIITDAEPEITSADVPKEVSEIEQVLSSRSKR